VVVTEAMANATVHAYRGMSRGPVVVAAAVTGDSL
jgi:anti-sigma regulatory factor (Ser/Thr protein kinase)